MKKLLFISLLKGVAIMLFSHAIGDLIFSDKFFEPDLIIYVVIGLIIGYILYRNNKKYKGYKV